MSVFLCTLAKPEFRLEMLVGSCTVWNMEFSLMARCRATKLSVEEMILSTRFSARLERENTFLVQCSLTWSQQLSVSKNEHLFKLIWSFDFLIFQTKPSLFCISIKCDVCTWVKGKLERNCLLKRSYNHPLSTYYCSSWRNSVYSSFYLTNQRHSVQTRRN